MRHTSKNILAAAAGALLLAGSATGASAFGGGSFDGGSFDGGFKPASYINPDIGAATANPDVNANSSCFDPDKYDMQAFSPAGTATKNVHNDACFLDDRGNKVGENTGASFQSRGVGFISACPDPDGAGPKIAILRDLNGDGRNDSCFQSGYQDKGIAGDDEFHARLNNNTAAAGTQSVKWGRDADADGRIDGDDENITIEWSANGTSGGSYSFGW